MEENLKQLLLKDLCARLPYGVICHTEKGDGHLCSINQTIFGTEYGLNINPVRRDYFNDSEQDEVVIKPYLRPICSMTDEERLYFYRNSARVPILVDEKKIITKPFYGYTNHLLDYLNEHHLDYRNLIPLGLALEAPEGMYKTE